MRLHGAIDIPPPGQSLGADIYRSYRTGETSWEDYLRLSAKMVADLCHEYRPVIYAPMPPPVWKYVNDRLNNGIQRDAVLSFKLGSWVMESFRALDQNRYLIDHFAWAQSKLDKPAFAGQRQTLEKAAERFEALRFPSQEYLRAIDVQRMDSEEKQRGKA